MSPERLRLFVALDLPAAVSAGLAGWAARAAVEGVRLVPEENLHVTLAFLGSGSPEEASAVGDVLEGAGAGTAVGPLWTGGALWLPPRRPGVLTVALRGGDGLAALHGALLDVLAGAIGFEPERRALRPHVTVGRVARGVRVDTRRALDPPPPELTFHAAALTLYRSRTGPGGSRYEALERAGLPS